MYPFDYNFSNYVWYWRTKHKIRISQFTVDPHNPQVADHSSELPLLEVGQPEANHNGGMLLFGSDGYLYVFIGDGGGAGDPHGDIGNGLKMDTLLGKVLRVDVDSNEKLYGIPEDNPFIGEENVLPEIYAYGIRNIWRCSLDKVTNQMFCGDVGQNKYEEINVIKKGGNYGWRAFEGFSCFDENLCNQTIYSHNHVKPVIVYNHSIGQSVVGGYVYRGCDSPDLKGKYFYADTMNGRIFTAQKNSDSLWESREVKMGNNSVCTGQLVGNYFRNILSFGESESGELFILASFYPKAGRPNSHVYQLVDPLKRGNPIKCKIEVKKAEPLKKIRNRNIYYKVKNIPIPKGCFDRSKRVCEHYFKSRLARKSAYD